MYKAPLDLVEWKNQFTGARDDQNYIFYCLRNCGEVE